MKKLTGKQVQNIVFTVIVTLAALALYLLAGKPGFPSGAEERAADDLAVPTVRASALPTESPAPTASPTASPLPTAAPGVSEGDFLAAVNEKLNVRSFSEAEKSLLISPAEERDVRARLIYSVQNGCVSGWQLRMEYPEKPKASGEKNTVDQALLVSYQTLLIKRDAMLKTVLPMLVSISDAQQNVPGVVALEWYDGALSAAASGGKRYDAKRPGCTFSAYVSQEGTVRLLVCSFLFTD